MPLNKTTAAYRPEAGSLAQRVIDMFSRAQDEEWTSSDLVRKLNVTSNSIGALLATPVSHGLLSFDRTDPEDRVKCWRAGPNLREWLALVASSVSSASSVTPSQTVAVVAAAAPTPRRTATAYDRLDPLAVPVRSSVPIPSIDEQRAIAAPCAVLWGRLKPGDSVELRDRHASSLTSYLKKNKLAHTVRRTGVGLKSVWRTA